MADRKWDAYRVLNITKRGSGEMNCLGQTKYGQRCRWDISDDNFDEVCSILSEMEKKSPLEASVFLRELAQLGLCEKFHQNQAEEVVSEWKYDLEDAMKEYRDDQGRRRQIQLLESQLEERKVMCDSVSARVDGLKAQLQQETSVSVRYKKEYTRVNANNEELSSQINKFRSLLVESNEESERLQRLLEEQRSALSSQRQEAEEYKLTAEATLTNQSQIIDNLQSERKEESCLLVKGLEALDEAKAERDRLLMETKGLRSKLNTQCQESKHAGKELNDATAQQTKSLAQIQNLEAQLSAMRQKTNEQAANHTELSKEMEASRSLLATERVSTSQLRRELDSIKKELSHTESILKRTQLDLENGHKASEEQKTVAAARDEAYSAETSRMLAQINQLEQKVSVSLLKKLMDRLKRFAKITSHPQGHEIEG
ncbi:hypothetical protein FQN54_004970 [Arachnomyces sp. PD_36]|nr:hypothetical protein FQN54_004970 [Arachnomyces sp. PD_36]